MRRNSGTGGASEFIGLTGYGKTLKEQQEVSGHDFSRAVNAENV
jgi:hypothetical protein